MARRLKAPRYELAKAQAVEVRVGRSCAVRACLLLGTDDIDEAKQAAVRLFASLRPEDFAHCEIMPTPSGPRYGDVYGTQDLHGTWFLKFELSPDERTIILSCHEPEHPLHLVDGRVLMPPRKGSR